MNQSMNVCMEDTWNWPWHAESWKKLNDTTDEEIELHMLGSGELLYLAQTQISIFDIILHIHAYIHTYI
jgi:hypothetical protein